MFTAKNEGICATCQNEIKIGDPIKWSRNEKGKVYHFGCIIGLIETHKTSENASLNGTAQNPLDIFINSLIPHIEGKIQSKMDEKGVIDLIRQYTSPSKSIEIKQADKPAVKIENVHELFEDLLYYISVRHHVYLYGAPGSGKSTSAHQVADALNIPFGYISLNPQTPDSRLLGFIDATGTYRPTVFYDRYVNGGVFCIDEMDNASASLLTTLNSMLENGHGAFPNGIHPRHADFVLVATGNTNGKGGNPAFPERRAFDSAFSERFTFLQWHYDTVLEKNICLSINPNALAWFDYVIRLRDFCERHHPKIIVSPRATYKGAQYLKDKRNIEKIKSDLIFKGCDDSTVQSINNGVTYAI